MRINKFPNFQVNHKLFIVKPGAVYGGSTITHVNEPVLITASCCCWPPTRQVDVIGGLLYIAPRSTSVVKNIHYQYNIY